MISKSIWARMLIYFIDGDMRFKGGHPWVDFRMWKGDW